MNPSEGRLGRSMSIFGKSGRSENDRVASRKVSTMDDASDIPRKKGGKKGSEETSPLPEGFIPGNDDVICGRGRNIWDSIGNRRFRRKVEHKVDEYSAAKTKVDKSVILSSIVSEIRKASPNGGFVRKDTKTGQWVEVGDFLAREKVSQSFRDALHDSYRSSNKTKRKRRIEEQEKTAEVNAEMQMAAMEQLQSGRTDKNLYEIICQQQSMLDDPTRGLHSMREDSNTEVGFISKLDNRLQDINTTALLHDSTGNIKHSAAIGSRRGGQNIRGDRSSELVEGQESTTQGLYEPSSRHHYFNTEPAGMDDQDGWRFSQRRLDHSAQAPSYPDNIAVDYHSNDFVQQLAAMIGYSFSECRTDDPWEPVPLAEYLTGDIDNIFHA